jgi:hypothetical protein
MFVKLNLGGHESCRCLYLHVVMNLGRKPKVILLIRCRALMLASFDYIAALPSKGMYLLLMFETGWLFGVCAHTVCETAKESS